MYLEYGGDVYLINAEKEKMYTLSEYAGVDSNLKAKETQSNALIVTDGIFYGLLTPNGLAGEGLKYTSYSYDENTGNYTLTLGSEKSVVYRILPNGKAEEIDIESDEHEESTASR